MGFFQGSGNAGPLKFKVFVELYQPEGLLAIPDPGGYLGEVVEFLFCIDKVFIFCLQSVIALLKCLSFAWNLSFHSAVFQQSSKPHQVLLPFGEVTLGAEILKDLCFTALPKPDKLPFSL